MFILLGRVHPAFRVLGGAIILVLGLVLHRVVLDAIGVIGLVLGVGFWVYASRRGGAGPRWRGRSNEPGDRW
jgi:hypothetical protein